MVLDASGAMELLLNTTRGRRLGTRLADGLRGPGGDARGIARHRRDRKLAGAPGLNVRVELVWHQMAIRSPSVTSGAR